MCEAVPAASAATEPTGGWRGDWAEFWFDTGPGWPLPEHHPLTDRRAQTG